MQCFSLGSDGTPLEVLATLEVKQQGIADICIRPDQRLFATAGWDGKVRLFHYKKMRPLAILQVRQYLVYGLTRWGTLHGLSIQARRLYAQGIGLVKITAMQCPKACLHLYSGIALPPANLRCSVSPN